MMFKVIALLCVTFPSVLSKNQMQINGTKFTDKYDTIDKELEVTRQTKELPKAQTDVKEQKEDMASVDKETVEDIVSDIVRKVEILNAEVDRQNLLIQDLRKDLEAKERSIDKMKSKIKDLEDINKDSKEVLNGLVNQHQESEKIKGDNMYENGNTRTVQGIEKDKISSPAVTSGQIAFNAYLTKGIKEQDLQQNLTVRFDKTLINVGDAYSNLTGKFTAPVDGTYFFNFHIVSNMMGLAYAYLMKNGQKQVSSILNPPNFAMVGSNMDLLSLVTGDSVWVEITYDVPVEIKADSQLQITAFSGFMLFQVFA